MSRLSVLFHKEKGEVFHVTIEYLEKVDLPKATKQAIAVSIMKAIHVGEGGQWDAQIEAGVVSALDYVLGEIRGWARRYDNETVPVPAPPIQGSIYGNFETPPVPDDPTLISRGYHSGNVIWGYGTTYYTIAPAGSVPPITAPNGDRVSDVPIRTIGVV